MALLILLCEAFQKLSSYPFGEQGVCFLTTEALFTSETFCKICQTALRHISKHSDVHSSRCDNLKCNAKLITAA